MSLAPQSRPASVPTCTLHLFVAFDWGDEIDLDAARRLAPSELHALPREPRTPPSIEYRPLPVRFRLSASRPAFADLAAHVASEPTIDVTVFDFGAIGVACRLRLNATETELTNIAEALSDPDPLTDWARTATEPLFERLLPAIVRPAWSALSEEYIVFAFEECPGGVTPDRLLQTQAAWLAALLRLESAPLSAREIEEALRTRMSYSPDDLVIVDWAGAVVIDKHPEEILDVLAFANLQLLELRQINWQLEQELETAWYISRRLATSWLPFWRTHARQVRAIGVVKVDAHGMLERTSNILKLVGDPYLARLYQLLVNRFRLNEWAGDNRHAISVLEGIYDVFTQQAGMYRAEFLELIIVLLILYEIISPLWK